MTIDDNKRRQWAVSMTKIVGDVEENRTVYANIIRKADDVTSYLRLPPFLAVSMLRDCTEGAPCQE